MGPLVHFEYVISMYRRIRDGDGFSAALASSVSRKLSVLELVVKMSLSRVVWSSIEGGHFVRAGLRIVEVGYICLCLQFFRWPLFPSKSSYEFSRRQELSCRQQVFNIRS